MGICNTTKQIDEKNLNNGKGTVKYDFIMKASKSVCRLYNKDNNEYATGFFMDIYPSFKCLLTNYKVITQNMIDSNSVIKISNNSGVNEELKLNKNERYIKCLEIYDITIIQIKASDKIYKYFDSLKPDLNYKNIPTAITEDILNVFCLHFPQGKDIVESVGTITKISRSNFTISITTGYGSLGCPVILTSNSNVIGINKLGKNITENYGTFIGVIFDEINKDIKNGSINIDANSQRHLLSEISNWEMNKKAAAHNEENIISSKIYIDNENINKDILIINSYEEYLRRKQSNNCAEELKNEKEIKECEIKIDDKLFNFSYTYKFDTVGEHTIIYKFKKNLTNLSCLFCDCSLITSIDLSHFNAEDVIYMGWMFYECLSLTNIDLSNFNTYNTIDMRFMFCFCKSLIKLDLSDFNTENVTDMNGMFAFCSLLNNLNLSNFNTKNVAIMSMMFTECKSLTELNLSNFDTQNVINMKSMFAECLNLKKLNLSSFNTKNVTNMEEMFLLCNSLVELDLSNFDTKKVTNMTEMFCFCSSLRDLDISNFDIQNVKKMDKMFYGCISLKKDKLNKLKNHVFIYSGNINNKGGIPYNKFDKITQNNPPNQNSLNKNIGTNPNPQKNEVNINNEDSLLGNIIDKLGITERKLFLQALGMGINQDMEHIQRHQLEFLFIPNTISELYSKGKINDNIMMNPSSWINYEPYPGFIDPRFLDKILVQKKSFKSGLIKFIFTFPPPRVGDECFFAILYFDEYKNSDYFTLELEFGNDFGTQNGTGLVCGQKEFQHLNYFTICKTNLEDFENIVRKLYPEY